MNLHQYNKIQQSSASQIHLYHLNAAPRQVRSFVKLAEHYLWIPLKSR